VRTAEQGTEAWRDGQSRLRRCLEAIALVGVVIAIGLVFDMGAAAYVAMSFPATVIFQLGVRRRPLPEMWVRDGSALSGTTIIPWLAALLAIPPLIALISGSYGDSAGQIIWFLAVIAGAVPASYVIAQRAPDTLRLIFLCLATGGLVGTLILSLNLIAEFEDLARRKTDFLDVAGADGLALVESFLVLWPGYYMVEEVLFRGSIDSHVHHPGERYGLWSAIFVSFLWGLWHLPVVVGPGESAGDVIADIFILQLAVGPFLSYWWRRSGNLLVPAVTHDWLDSFRNAFVGTP
jgi:membrane protease YdiL (CAAX protease family)